MTANKKWLNNNPEEFGSVCWSAEQRIQWKGGKKIGVKKGCYDASVRLTDCYKAVDLDFSYYDRETFEDRCVKIHNLISELSTFERILSSSYIEPDIEEDTEEVLTPVGDLLKEVIDDS